MGVFLSLCILGVYLAIKAGCTNGSKTVFFFVSTYKYFAKFTVIKIKLSKHSHCTFASRKNGSTPSKLYKNLGSWCPVREEEAPRQS